MNKCMSTCVGICVCIHVCVCFYLSLSTYLLLALRLALMLKRRARLAGPFRCEGGRRGSLAETQETFMRWCSCTYKFKHTNAHIYTHTRMTHVCMYMRTHACTQGMARHGTAQTHARTDAHTHTRTHERTYVRTCICRRKFENQYGLNMSRAFWAILNYLKLGMSMSLKAHAIFRLGNLGLLGVLGNEGGKRVA